MNKGFTLIELLAVVAIISLLLMIMLPGLQTARENARSVYCLNNINQMLIALNCYTENSNGQFPVAYIYDQTNEYSWDFFIYRPSGQVAPGWLWMGRMIDEIQQCPSFRGTKIWGRPYSGYNYNTSYLGRGTYERVRYPAKICEVQDPTNCAAFGDGQYYGGTNNFMRSPFPSTYETKGVADSGTQGYRHNRQTNVGFVDGHSKPMTNRFSFSKDTPDDCGFISQDNSLYDLE